MLLLATLLPVLGWWWLTRRQGALRHPLTTSIKQLRGGRGRIAFWGGFSLRMLALSCLILALSGPRWPDMRTRVRTEGIAIVMVVDVSGSMAKNIYEERSFTRLDAVKDAFRLFVFGGTAPDGTELEGRLTDRVGLVAFATTPETVCSLTLSRSALGKALDRLQPKELAGEMNTNIIDALALGIHVLESAGPRRKVLILLSDGEHDPQKVASQWTMQDAIDVAVAKGVPIYAINTGTEKPDASQMKNRKDAELTLSEIAEGTHGQHFHAENTHGLLDVYRAIDSKERESIESFQYRRYHEAFPWLSLAAFGLLVLVQGLEMTLWRRVP